MQDELMAVIDKNLPAAIGEQLRKRLEQAAKTDKTNTALAEEVAELRESVERAEKLVKQHAILSEREKSLEKNQRELEMRERSLAERDATQRATLAEVKEQAANDKANAIYRLAEIAMGKRSYTERLERSDSKQVPGSNGYSSQFVSESGTVTKTVEQIG